MKHHLKSMNTLLAVACCLLLPAFAHAQWTALSSGTTSNLHGVYFFNADTGFVIGGDFNSNSIILKTVNGGATWTTVYSKVTNDNLESITFSSPSHGFVTGGTQTGGNVPILLYTTDGGNTWSHDTIVPMSGDFSAVQFADTDTGYTTGANLQQYGMKTVNGGATWTNLPPAADDYSTICFITGSKGFLAPDNGGMLVSTNGGNTWVPILPATIGFLSDIHFTTPTTGIAVGGTTAGTDPLILKTANAGASWTVISGFTNGGLDHISFPDPLHGFAIGFETSDLPLLIATTDSGNHWDTMPPPVTSAHLYGLCFPTATVGYVVGDSGKIFKYRNTTLVKNVTENDAITIYPNPVKNTCYWKVNSSYNNAAQMIALYSITGRLVATTAYQQGMLDMSGLASGMYILRFGDTAKLVEKE